MEGGWVQREIVPNSLYSLLFYFELFPKKIQSIVIEIELKSMKAFLILLPSVILDLVGTIQNYLFLIGEIADVQQFP